MKLGQAILFVIAILLEVGGFIVGHDKFSPVVPRFIAPRCSRALQGLETLTASKVLEASHPGFQELGDIVLSELALHNPADKLHGIRVVRLRKGDARIEFGPGMIRNRVQLLVELSNNQTPVWDIESLTDRVRAWERAALFKAGLIVFVAGLAVNIAAFVVGQGHGNAAKKGET